MTDPLHLDFRNFIHTAYKNLAGMVALKNVAIDLDLASFGMEEFTPENQVRNRWACGTSANRICAIFTGKELADYSTSGDAIDLGDADAAADALREMQATPGYVLVRINILGGGAGHSYVWVSISRGKTQPLDGYVYQTNVGIDRRDAFCLNDWVEDPKSVELINLSAHLGEVGQELCGLSADWGTPAAASKVYEKNYTLTNRPLRTDEVADLNTKAANPTTRGKVKFQWLPVKPEVPRENLRQLRFKTAQIFWSGTRGLTADQARKR